MLKATFILLFFMLSLAFAQEKYVVAVGEADLLQETIVVNTVALEGESDVLVSRRLEEFPSIIINDLSFYPKFFVGKQVSAALENEFLLKITAKQEQKTVRIKSVLSKKGKYFEREQVIPLGEFREQYRHWAHRISDFVFKSLQGGKDSIFLSEIVFVSDRTSVGDQVFKELYIMDFDGSNVRRLTGHRGIVISPAVSPDKRFVAYSLLKKRPNGQKEIALYLLDIATRKERILSNRPGINSGAYFHPDGESLYVSMSFVGNTEIYRIDLKGNIIEQMTKNYAEDVDPSLNADGSMMTFLSSRSGKAMIYTMDTKKKEETSKRISYVGTFNATPRFSPSGKEIVFSSWYDNKFDLFRIGADGLGLVRLTKNFGSNEDPVYSFDGEFIAFNSKRVLSRKRAVQNLYIATRDGLILKKISDRFGNCTSPRWIK